VAGRSGEQAARTARMVTLSTSRAGRARPGAAGAVAIRSSEVVAQPRDEARPRNHPKGSITMPKSRSKRRRYQPPPRPKPKPSPPWVGPTIVLCLVVGLIYILLYYIDLLPGPLRDLNAINLAIGFTPVVAGLLLATRWT
jgi:Cell division protein CrgA